MNLLPGLTSLSYLFFHLELAYFRKHDYVQKYKYNFPLLKKNFQDNIVQLWE